MMETSRFFNFFPASRKARAVLFAAALVSIVLLVGVFRHFCAYSSESNEEKAPEVDTLALNIICTPTLDCLPFYHAVESGLCDSVGLALCIRTETSQFDVDSIMSRTTYMDGAVFDDARLAHYRSLKGTGKADVGKAVRKAAKSSPKTAPGKQAEAVYCPWWSTFPALTEAVRLDNTWRLVTSSALRIREVAKMKKRTVAVSRLSASTESLKSALAQGGLKEKDVYQAQINSFPVRQQMLDEDQVDAAVLPEPFATLAVLAGHRAIWTSDTLSRTALYLRSDALKKPRKQEQLKLLKRVYRSAVDDMNRRGAHAADSALIKRFGLAPEVIDTLRLPKYK